MEGKFDLLETARSALNDAERACALLRGQEVRDQELGDAVARIQAAHGLLWRLGRRLAGHEEANQRAPLRMSIDYVAWVLADDRADHWTAELLRLMARADPLNRAKLGLVFPREHAALQAWEDAPFGEVTHWPPPVPAEESGDVG